MVIKLNMAVSFLFVAVRPVRAVITYHKKTPRKRELFYEGACQAIYELIL